VLNLLRLNNPVFQAGEKKQPENLLPLSSALRQTPSINAGVIIQDSGTMEQASDSNCTPAERFNNPSFQAGGNRKPDHHLSLSFLHK